MQLSTLHLLSCLSAAGGVLGATAASAATQDSVPYTESGQATWYGGQHEGNRTSSGEVFDGAKLTAAHPSLPMGSYVRVTVQQTGRSIVVRVNDREPPHGVRCIDLSHAAAERLGIVSRGVADVSLAQVSSDEMVEVAEAAEDAGLAPARVRSIARHGRRHTRRARR
jgi:rare lipoprotein A